MIWLNLPFFHQSLLLLWIEFPLRVLFSSSRENARTWMFWVVINQNRLLLCASDGLKIRDFLLGMWTKHHNNHELWRYITSWTDTNPQVFGVFPIIRLERFCKFLRNDKQSMPLICIMYTNIWEIRFS